MATEAFEEMKRAAAEIVVPETARLAAPARRARKPKAKAKTKAAKGTRARRKAEAA